jgi:hypothetical protein
MDIGTPVEIDGCYKKLFVHLVNHYNREALLEYSTEDGRRVIWGWASMENIKELPDARLELGGTD